MEFFGSMPGRSFLLALLVAIAPAGCSDGGNGIVSETFLPTGNMGVPRGYHTATLLQDGRVLIAGGRDDSVTEVASAELYDPARGIFSPASNDMSTGRKFHSATLLADGKVLVTGGNDGSIVNNGTVNLADVFDPAASAFTRTGDMASRRQEHTATLLANGMVLIAGGSDRSGGGTFLATTELFDPVSGKFIPSGPMTTPRSFHTATLLDNGSVLIAGGYDGASIATTELFDPVSGKFAPSGPMSTPRSYHTATLMDNGSVLLIGGTNGGTVLASAEIYDPVSGSFRDTSGTMHAPRFLHTATSLPGGEVLVAGGYATGDLDSAERFDPLSGTFLSTGNLLTRRDYHTATLLQNNTVLVTGGFVDSYPTRSAELYFP